MTDKDIIKALECCRDCKCKECPCYNKETDGCKEIDEQDILDLINRQKADLELKTMDILSLTNERDALEEMIAEQKAEITILKGRLNNEYRDCVFVGSVAIHKNHLRDFANFLCLVKKDAIKEFAERFEDEMGEDFFNHYPFVLTALDNLVKEMEGD